VDHMHVRMSARMIHPLYVIAHSVHTQRCSSPYTKTFLRDITHTGACAPKHTCACVEEIAVCVDFQTNAIQEGLE
jgi:hypothetical protein